MKYVLLLLLPLCFQMQAQTSNFDGSWTSTVKGVKMHINIDNEENSVHLTIPAQGVLNAKANAVEIQDTSISFFFSNFNASFIGSSINNEIDGNWKQNNLDFPMVWKKSATPFVTNRPQTPKAPFNYQITDVEFASSQNQINLSGTVTRPEGNGPFPAILLIPGSGPVDRNESIMGHQPLHVMADYFTKQGYVTLRYDKIGVGLSEGNSAKSTTLTLADDAKMALEALRGYDFVKNDNVGIIGHSEGGMIAAIIASEDNDLAYIVSLAGPGQTGKEILNYQLSRDYKNSDELSSETAELMTSFNSKALDIASSNGKPNDEKFSDFQELGAKTFSKLSEEEKQMFGQSSEVFSFNIASGLLNPWMQTFISLDPSKYWEKVEVPVLAMNGAKDRQVKAKENLSAIKDALKEGGNKDFKTKKFCRTNHLFQKSKSGNPSEYMSIETTIEPKVLKKMNKWISSQN